MQSKTSPDKERVLQTVRGAIEAFNEQLPPERRLVADLDCALVGSPDLDSTDLVNILFLVEQRIEQDLGLSMTLFESIDRLTTIEALVDVVADRLIKR